MFETLKNAFKVKEIRKKIFIILCSSCSFTESAAISPFRALSSSEFTSIVENGNNFLDPHEFRYGRRARKRHVVRARNRTVHQRIHYHAVARA